MIAKIVVALSMMTTVVTAIVKEECPHDYTKMNFRNGDYAGWYKNPAHFEAAGVKDVLAKCIGSTNPVNVDKNNQSVCQFVALE